MRVGGARSVTPGPVSCRSRRSIMRGHVRTLDNGNDVSQRRTFLQMLAAQGVVIPAAHFAVPRGARAHQPGEKYDAAPASAGQAHIVREFAEPYLELIRLLRQATEI